MKENLKIGTMINGSSEQTDNATIEKYCFDDNPTNCDTYGGLYQWNEMMQYVTTEGARGICPEGWHLPTDAEWCILEQGLDPSINCSSSGSRGIDGGGKMKETGILHWQSPNNGATNSSGFTALPGGWRGIDAAFYNHLLYAYFWSSSASGPDAYIRGLYYLNAMVERNAWNIDVGLSVRCIQDSIYGGGNTPPTLPAEPSPPDGAINQSTSTTVHWSCSDPNGDPLSYDVYFGETDPPPMGVSGISDTTYDPGTLNNGTTYFWKIVVSDGTDTTEGNIWSFTTQAGFTCGDLLADIDGNSYNTVLIDTLCMMKENLRTTTYANGTPIPNVTDNTAWGNLTTPGYAWYDNDISWKDIYGAMYNWYATVDANGLCPAGWHVPDAFEWTALTNYIGGTGAPHGNELKSCRQVNSPLGGNCNTSLHPRWEEHSTQYGTDDYGFSGLPGGYRYDNGQFNAIDHLGQWWVTTQYFTAEANASYLYYSTGSIVNWHYLKQHGFSVRCLRD
jgi:uncharacterized protein (TIGR02145 family)